MQLREGKYLVAPKRRVREEPEMKLALVLNANDAAIGGAALVGHRETRAGLGSGRDSRLSQ